MSALPNPIKTCLALPGQPHVVASAAATPVVRYLRNIGRQANSKRN